MQNIIKTILEFVVGIALLPVAGAFVAYVIADPNLSSIVGFSLIMSLALFVIGFGLIYHVARQFFGK
jgi:hypothetical protein